MAVLGQRVTGLEHTMQTVVEALNNLGAKIDAKSVTNWAPISVGVTVLAMLGAVVYMPIKDAQVRQEAMMDRILSRIDYNQDKITERTVPRSEYAGDMRDVDRRLERLIKRLDNIEYAPPGAIRNKAP